MAWLAATLSACATSEPAEEIIGRDWALPAGSEMFKCVGVLMDHDIHIDDLETRRPLGEHHAILSVSDRLLGPGETHPGEYDCTSRNIDPQVLFDSVLPVAMPDGIDVKAGQYLNLNLHLFNASDEEITGHSAIVASMRVPSPRS
jgi:hypothetical protein